MNVDHYKVWKVCMKCDDYVLPFNNGMEYFDILEEIKDKEFLTVQSGNDIILNSRIRYETEHEIRELLIDVFNSEEMKDDKEQDERLKAILKSKGELTTTLFTTSKCLYFLLNAVVCGALELVNYNYTSVNNYYFEYDKSMKSRTVIESITVSKGRKYNEWQKRLMTIKKLGYIAHDGKCPRCGGELDEDFEVAYNADDYEREAEREVYNKKSISQANITTYLTNLVAVENSIMFYENLLDELDYQKERLKLCENVRKDKIDIAITRSNANKEIEHQIKELDMKINYANKIMDNKELLAREFSMEYRDNLESPLEPQIQKPIMPIMKKAGLFNKKKIERENNANIAYYEQVLDAYNKRWESYQSELQSYYRFQEGNKLFDEQYHDLILKHQEKIQGWNDEREALCLKCSLYERENYENILDELKQQNSWKLLEFCNGEIREIKETLKKLIQCRVQLHSFGIIYPKYLDYVSVVTILEYFQSGRCSELTGAHGAYNLYEDELRHNIIIDKLDDIVERLDDIKKNQSLIYTSLMNIDNSVSKLNDTFGQAIVSLEKIEKNTAMTAYYSAKTAEYTKRNAELTNALGYLVAFK